MDEKVYKTLNSTGKLNIILGIISIAFAVGTGVVFIINGARALKAKSRVMF